MQGLHYSEKKISNKEVISHDLRTPLTAKCGYLDLLDGVEQSETVRRYIEQIRGRSDTLKQLTEELFRYSVIASTPELTYERVNLCLMLEDALQRLAGGIIAITLINISLKALGVKK